MASFRKKASYPLGYDHLTLYKIHNVRFCILNRYPRDPEWLVARAIESSHVGSRSPTCFVRFACIFVREVLIKRYHWTTISKYTLKCTSLISLHRVWNLASWNGCVKKDLRICWDKKLLQKLKWSIRKDRITEQRTFCRVSVLFTFPYHLLYISLPFVPVFKKKLCNNNISYVECKQKLRFFFFNSHNSILILFQVGRWKRKGGNEKYFHQVSIVLRPELTISPGWTRDRWALQLRSKFALLPRLTLLARVLKVSRHASTMPDYNPR